ncbi:MAG: hypothetical protein UU47_C0016G0016 [candidate division TM6 bacterium GW2011_GWE2_41_16]|nr:MAG: hypothetical protein UU47_C0016G0016 [candidate division TM6 bacterium GW2011_GWE2_41_16]
MKNVRHTPLVRRIELICLSFTICYVPTLLSLQQYRDSKMYFTERPLAHYSFVYKTEPATHDRHCTALEAFALSNKSLDTECANKYFLFDCKSALLIANSDAPNYAFRDIDAFWFDNLENSPGFNADLMLSPRSESYGARIKATRRMGDLLPIPFFQDTYLAASTGIVSTKNNLIMSTNGAPNSPTTQSNLALLQQAFDNQNWNFMRVKPTPQCRTHVPDITLIYGSTLIDCEHVFLEYNSLVVVPLENSQDPKYLFSPYTGPNKHWGVGINFYLNVPLMDNCQSCVNAWASLENTFYFRRAQMRTFDLKYKPYTRYLKVHRKGIVESIPAMNVLTVPCKVKPSDLADLSFGLTFEANFFSATIGYNLWTHPTEKIFLRRPCCTADSLKDRYIYPFEAYGVVAHDNDANKSATKNSTIKYHATTADDDLEFTGLTESDLDMFSPAAQTGLLNTVFATASLHNASRAITVDFGGYYSAPYANMALKGWGLYAALRGEF